MIALSFNLHCRNGHRYYAPRRELREWIGRECLHGGKMRADGTTEPGRCLHTLRKVSGSGAATR